MSSRQSWRWGPLMLAIVLLAIAPAATAAITPESDVLLPWFEIDLDRQDVGLATSFSIVNASPSTTRTKFTIYTNWGIPVLEVPIDFDRTEAKTIDLRKWIATGVLPNRTLTPSELAHLHAALTGKPSPVDGLYYSSVFEDGLAVGYVIAQTLGDRPDALWGDTYSIDIGSDYFEAETLTALTHGLKADCKRHGVRFVNQDRLYEGSELIIWSGRRMSPSKTPAPAGAKVKVTIGVYNQAGQHVQDCYRELIAVEPLQVCHLDITPPIGWLDVKTEEPTVILEHLHSTSQASAELHSYCLSETLQFAGPSITIAKSISGDDADRPQVKFDIGSEVEFEYRVTNNGTVLLSPVTVTDSDGIDVTCPETSLDPGESMLCTARTLAEGCLHMNVGTATGIAPDGKKVTAEDIAYYEGTYSPALALKTLVNDNDANEAPGPYVDAGDPLHWTFVVTNTGDVRLEGIAVSRSKGEAVSCPKTALDPAESMTCTAESLADEGQRHEIGTAMGADPCGVTVTATDPAYYFGRRNAPDIEIKKLIGENDANTPPGPTVAVGTTIQWRFLVTNTGNLPLQNVVVTDDQGITPTCPKTALEPGESMICTASSLALPCQHANTAEVTGTATERERTVKAHDSAHYFGEGHPALTLELKLNGDAADEPPGPWLDEGATIALTYEVTNTGDVELTNLVASDEYDRTATCPKTSLQPGESMVCTASLLAVGGMHDLIGTAYGRPPCGDPVQADDPVHYRGRALTPSIDIMKMTNGVHAETAPGPSVAIGSAIEWTYLVTNTGAVQLTDISVTDSREVAVTCPKTVLDPGESMTCTASGIAQACQYSNTATAQGKPAQGEAVTARDDSFYYGQPSAAITIDKRINGEDAPEAPGPSINAGATIQWSFAVTNKGDVTLTEVTVTDDRSGAVTCPKSTLAPGESMTCTASGTALAGPQRNVAGVSGKPPCGNAATASDASHYRGVTPGIRIEKLINGEDADDSAHAVQLMVGDAVLWSFVVTNVGDVALSDVSVTDSVIRNVSCPKTTLDPGESMTCTASGIAEQGLDCDTGTATGTSPQSTTVTSSDSACYQGNTALITIEKRTNGADADTPPGPEIPVGGTVNWTYVVTNTGEVALTGVSVTDDRGVTVTCPKTTLAAGESMTCTASGTAVAGQYSNIGTASGTPPAGGAVTASDPSHYNGIAVADQGCTPGYWKNHTDSWPPTGYSPTQTVSSAFAQSALYPTLGAASLLDSLGFAGGAGAEGAAEILLRAATAALLNAAHGGVSYPRTAASVIADVNAALATQNRDAMLALAAALDADNNRGCPLN